MPIVLALLFGAQLAPAPLWQLSDAIVVSGVSRGGRVPFPQDDVLSVLVERGDQTVFKAGDTIPGRGGAVHTWVVSKANDKGALNQPQAGYIQAVIHSDSERAAILNVNGAGALYFNGALRPGDVYGYGYLSLPVQVHRGDNTLLVASGRGALTARLDAPKAAQQFNLGDPTLPDVLTSDSGTLTGAVVVLNNSASPATKLKIRATIGDRTIESSLPKLVHLRSAKFRSSFRWSPARRERRNTWSSFSLAPRARKTRERSISASSIPSPPQADVYQRNRRKRSILRGRPSQEALQIKCLGADPSRRLGRGDWPSPRLSGEGLVHYRRPDKPSAIRIRLGRYGPARRA
jgi:hypothetical protein